MPQRNNVCLGSVFICFSNVLPRRRSRLHYLPKISDDFNFLNFVQKVSKFKPYKIFKRPKYYQYSETMLVSRNKVDVKRKCFEPVGIVVALTKELAEGLFADH